MRLVIAMTALLARMISRIHALNGPQQQLRSLTSNYHRKLHCNSLPDGSNKEIASFDTSNTPNPRKGKLFLPNHQSHRPITTVMAPMVSSSDYAFRCLVRQYTMSVDGRSITGEYDAPLVFTQMLHARNLIQDEPFFRNHFDIYECAENVDAIQRDLTESQRNIYSDDNVPTSSRFYESPCAFATKGPVIAQLAGCDVTTVVKAAQKIVTSTNGRIAGIDLNLGCPQNIARKGNYGAYLMENHPSTACTILKALRDALPSTVALSAKIRLPYNPTQQIARLQQLCDTGLNFITIHGRDYTENKTTVKHIQLHRLIDAVNTIHRYSHGEIPVVVNGGIEFASDATHIREVTGAAAIMSSEALLETPNLLGEIQVRQQRVISSMSAMDCTSVTTPPKQLFLRQIQFALDYIRWCYYTPPLSSGLGNKGGSFNVVRGHLFKMLYRYFTDPMNYDLRDKLGNGYDMQRLDQAEVLVQTLRERYDSYSDIEWALLTSSQFPTSSWYRRHRSTSVMVHERIKPIIFTGSDTGNNNQQETSSNAISIDERKIMIRKNIEQLRKQKKQTL